MDYHQNAINFATAAIELDKNKQYDQAIQKYKEASLSLVKVIQGTKNDETKSVLNQKLKEWIERANLLQKFQTSQLSDTEQQKLQLLKNEQNIKEEEQLTIIKSQAILVEIPNIKWSDVLGLDQAKSSLQETIILPIKFPQLFTNKMKPRKIILLYGPRGSGKAYLAKATATESNSTLFSVDSYDVMNKWKYDAEKLIKALFEMARKTQPSIIFIDKIEYLCGMNIKESSDHTRRIYTELLIQLQFLCGSTDNVYVLISSNAPWDLEPSLRRRIEKRIYLSLPTKETRKLIIIKNIGNEVSDITDEDHNILADKTEGYSSLDIITLTKEALMQPMKKCQLATLFKLGSDGFYYPTTSDDPQGINLTECKDNTKIRNPKLVMDDFLQALIKCKKTVSNSDMEAQEQWANEFGGD